MGWRGFLLLALLPVAAFAERGYPPERMEALVAPVALYPDVLIADIVAAAAYPEQVAAAARSPQADDPSWNRAVRALEPFPELLDRMAGSEQWMRDLAYAQRSQPADFARAIKSLRRQAYDDGRLASTLERDVVVSGGGIAIQPPVAQVLYVPYYNPLAVYGKWRPAWPVAQWQPWPTRRAFIDHEQRRRRDPNGPASPAQRMQPQVSPAQQMQPQVSPAQQMQQQIQRERDQQLERQKVFGR